MAITLFRKLMKAVTHDRYDVDITPYPPSEISRFVYCGLGALLHHACRLTPINETTSGRRATLEAANLTAQVLNGLLLDATVDVLRAAGKLSPSITLLKGISVCQEIYPQAHLRPMGDIDLLVELEAHERIEAVLLDLGYRQRSDNPPDFYTTHHHSMPFHHVSLPICIEVHTALFSKLTTVGSDKIFSPETIQQNRIAFDFRGYRAFRLRPELQLAYICSHMAEHLTFSNEAIALTDIVLLLHRYAATFDWDWLFATLDQDVAATHVYLLLDYLQRKKLAAIPPQVSTRLRKIQTGVNPVSRHILHGVIGRYLPPGGPTSGSIVSSWHVKILWETLMQPRHPLLNVLQLPWNLLFPPGRPDRYSPRLWWSRWRSLWRRVKES